MLAHQLVQYLSWAVYVFLCGVTVFRAMRKPQRTHLHVALFFSVPALIILVSVLVQIGVLHSQLLLRILLPALLLALGYLLVLLAEDFAGVPNWLLWAAPGAYILGIIALAFAPSPLPALLGLALGFYLIGLLVFAGIRFAQTTGTTSGVTQRRMRAIATGTLLLALLFCLSLTTPLVPQSASDTWRIFQDLIGLASGIGFFMGFTPPVVLRRAWQEPELRALLGRVALLSQLPDQAATIRALEEGAQQTLGARGATIGLFDSSDHMLHMTIDPSIRLDPNSPSPGALAFRTQQPVFSDDVPRDFPAYAAQSRQYGATAVLVAPISIGAQRLGILTLFAPRAPIFAEDDLALVQLVADQAAVLLESRRLIDDVAQVQAREEVSRLKEDFLAAAAHDLKTPLTTVIARAQVMERRALRNPNGPADLPSIQILVRETRRLQRLVHDLLDASRAEYGQLGGKRQSVDLTELAHAVCERHSTAAHQCVVQADGPVVGVVDDVRIEQVLENLVENAIKYSPDTSPVRLVVQKQDDDILIKVSDQGIGIPPDDLVHVFDRFYRSSNVNDQHSPGMGLGLFICRTIIEEHGGQIWATSTVNQGTTFHIRLPQEHVMVDVHEP